MKTKTLFSLIGTGLILLFVQYNANAEDHPHYLRALSDMRAARWMINHRPGNWEQTQDEISAVKEIDEALLEIRKASVDDGKDINDHPKVDEMNDHMGRLREAFSFLRKAREDVNQEEDNQFADQLKQRSLKHIAEAIKFTKRAISLTH